MNEEARESDLNGPEESRTGRILGNWRSCVLLLVMLLGLLATPLALFYRWYSDRSANDLSYLLGQETGINRIAFITLNGQLATMAPDGSDVRRLSDDGQRFEFPAWAPDGKQLAAISRDKLLLISVGDRAESGGDAVELYENQDEAPFYLFWSPDSQHLTFLTSHPEGIALHAAHVRALESSIERIAIGQPFYWDWSPESDELFIHSGGSGANARLETIDLRGETTAANFGEAGIFQAPGISPSGRFKAFAVLDEQGRSRLAIQDEFGDIRQFEAHFGQITLAWSPAVDVLAYKSPRINSGLGGGPLRLADPRTNDGVLLSNENILAFFWSPDGRTIAYFTMPQRDDDNVRVAEAGSRRTLRARSMRQPGELRMELWAVDVASGNQRRLAQFTPTTLFLRQFLPFSDQYALSHRLWSPGSDALVLPVLEEGRSQIAVIPLSRGDVTLVADGLSAFWSHQ